MAFVCSNPECNVTETGKCVDGFEVGECPHAQQDDSTVEESDKIPSVELMASAATDDIVDINDGEILSVNSAADILRYGPSRVITVIGPSDAGKTTFALCLYEAFQHGPFDKWEFAGSMTLTAFEMRCHASRAKSGNSVPQTHRTPIGEVRFLHLAVHNEISGRLELLISDRSGEHYEDVANGVEGCEQLHEVTRADYILFFVDGKRLTGDERHGIKSDVGMLMRSLIEAGALGKTHCVGIVLTKYDQVQLSPHAERAEMDFQGLMATLQDKYGSSLASLKEFRIAARSENTDIDPLHGVVELLDDCVARTPAKKYIPDQVVLPDRFFVHLEIEDGGAL